MALKRTPFKRKASSTFKAPRKPLRIEGHSDTAQVKKRIQDLLRQIVIARDKGCIMRNKRLCGGNLGVPGIVLQADHLITRANSATYADSRLVVCVCRPCHAWKSLGGNMRKAQYDALVRTILPPDRVNLWDACEADSWRPTRTGKSDWVLAEQVLARELEALEKSA